MQAGYPRSSRGRKVGFADIFSQTHFQNGLLAIELDDADWQAIAGAARKDPSGTEVTVDLREQTVKLHSDSDVASGAVDSLFTFEIAEAHRHRLLHGLDSIGETLLHDQAISRHEQHLPPWVATANLDLDRRDM